MQTCKIVHKAQDETSKTRVIPSCDTDHRHILPDKEVALFGLLETHEYSIGLRQRDASRLRHPLVLYNQSDVARESTSRAEQSAISHAATYTLQYMHPHHIDACGLTSAVVLSLYH